MKRQKSELELDKDYELFKQRHSEFYAKVEHKRVCEMTLDEWKYFVTYVLPEIGELGAKKKEEAK